MIATPHHGCILPRLPSSWNYMNIDRMQDLNKKIAEIRGKIERERIIIHGARQMYSKTDNPAVQNSLRSKIQESERNINYLIDNLKKLELKASPTPSPQQPHFSSPYGSPPTGSGGYGASGGYGGAGNRLSGGPPPIPPPKDLRGPSRERENGGAAGYGGQRMSWGQQGIQQLGPPVPAKSRQYTKLGISRR